MLLSFQRPSHLFWEGGSFPAGAETDRSRSGRTSIAPEPRRGWPSSAAWVAVFRRDGWPSSGAMGGRDPAACPYRPASRLPTPARPPAKLLGHHLNRHRPGPGTVVEVDQDNLLPGP